MMSIAEWIIGLWVFPGFVVVTYAGVAKGKQDFALGLWIGATLGMLLILALFRH